MQSSTKPPVPSAWSTPLATAIAQRQATPQQGGAASAGKGPGTKAPDGKASAPTYFQANLPCLKTPLARPTTTATTPGTVIAKDSKGKASDPSIRTRRGRARVRVPFNMTPESLVTTFEDLSRAGVALITGRYVYEVLSGLERPAQGKDSSNVPSGSADKKAKQTACDATPDPEDAFERTLMKFKLKRSFTPDWRSQDLVLEGDSAIDRAADDLAVLASPIPRRFAASDGKSSATVLPGRDLTTELPPIECNLKPYAVGKKSVSGPIWLGHKFFPHITGEDIDPEDLQTSFNGHVRVSHDTNAFPRSWSLEKIGRVVAHVVAIASRNKAQLRSAINFSTPLCAHYQGLNIHVFLGARAFREILGTRKPPVPLQDAELTLDRLRLDRSIITAYISRTTSAREAEIGEIRAAVNLMRGIENLEARAIIDRMNPKSVWSVLSAASALCWVQGQLGLTEAEKAIIRKLGAGLSIGETRHSVHRARIHEGTCALLRETNHEAEAAAFPRDTWDAAVGRIPPKKDSKVAAPGGAQQGGAAAS